MPAPTPAPSPVLAADPLPPSGWETFYHPASGALILGIDILAFGGELATGFLDVVLVSLASFAVVFAGVWTVQRRWGGSTRRAAFWKAFLGAFLAGIPFPITGTLFGTAILFLSGLHHLKLRAGLAGVRAVMRRG